MEHWRLERAFYGILRQINSSRGDVGDIFRMILAHAMEFCDANLGILFTYEGGAYRAIANANITKEFQDWLQDREIRANPATGLGRIAASKSTLHIDDVRGEELYRSGNDLRIATADLGGARTFLAVPMLNNDELIGAFTIYRTEVKPFTDDQIATVQAFAEQAALALNNARLVQELHKNRTELANSLTALKAAQDRLVQTEKLASLGQLTAGIAHEIKNPLNFVNNFAALSAELTEDLKETLAPAPLDNRLRSEVDEMAEMLKSNLEKVVQHGKRADSIVRNMLQHSRASSGERRSQDLNALVSETLKLAYQGTRAERSDFKITLEQDLDPRAGMAEVYPQDLTRALLNLISNGFYAATTRKIEAKDKSFVPVLSAATKAVGDAVEIRIRDNGTGIPSDIKGKIFNPFFTTKPTGEGTGLGLSLAYDIIVKQHGGWIDVDSEEGVFTEFVIVLPRGIGAAAGTNSE